MRVMEMRVMRSLPHAVHVTPCMKVGSGRMPMVLFKLGNET